MSTSGRYYIVDEKTGRKFCIEPLHSRNEKETDVTFTNGGICGNEVKGKPSNGGSIREEDSIITEENGFKDIVTVGPYVSPEGYIDYIIKNSLKLTSPEAIVRGKLPLNPHQRGSLTGNSNKDKNF